MSRYTWDKAARELALRTRLTQLEAEDLLRPLQGTPLDPETAANEMRIVLLAAEPPMRADTLGAAIARIARAGIPRPKYMQPGTIVLARRFGQEIKARVTASGGSTFTVAAVDEDDYTVWQDMTFDDVTIIEGDSEGNT